MNRLLTTPDDLHVVSSLTAVPLLCQALGIPEEAIYASGDHLSDGPLMGHLNVPDWTKLRRDYWTKIIGAPDISDDAYLYSRIVRDQTKFQNCRYIVLWLGSILSEQLLRAWLVVIFSEHGIDSKKIRLVDFPPPRTAPHTTLSLMNPNDVQQVHSWSALSSDRIEKMQDAWRAVTSSDPTDLVQHISKESISFGSTVLSQLLHRYPAFDSGLNKWDVRLLERYQKRRAVKIIGCTMGDCYEDSDWVGDFYLFYRLKKMPDSRLAYPLLTLTGDLKSMHTTEVSITKVGEDVLARQTNFVQLNGIDEWVGGVHLNSAQKMVWFFDGKQLIKQ